MRDKKPCLCNSGKLFAECCEPLHVGTKDAGTAEALMRSRYSAYVEGKVDYLLKTWHPSSRPAQIAAATIPQWCGLHIVDTQEGGESDKQGIVEFKATFLSQGKAQVLHEISRFVKEEGLWFYLDGEIQADSFPAAVSKKAGRNEPCPCGSGRKFKKCCGP